MISRCSLGDVSKKLIGKLSKGYRQRVGLAQAILHNPDVLILDEPTSGLDPKQIIEIRDLLKQLSGDHTIILSTHILTEVEQSCERVMIISPGQLVAIDSLVSQPGPHRLRGVGIGAPSRWRPVNGTPNPVLAGAGSGLRPVSGVSRVVLKDSTRTGRLAISKWKALRGPNHSLRTGTYRGQFGVEPQRTPRRRS